MATKRMTWMAAVLGTVALSGMVSCNVKGKEAGGAAAVSVGGQALTLGDVKSVTVTVSGGITTPLTVPLVGGGAQYSALISDLPIGSNYIFTASAKDTNSVELYHGQATNVTIAKNATATVIIDMNQDVPGVALSNEAPVIDSLTASALLVSPNDTVTIRATAHDPDAGQTAHLQAVWTTTCAGSLGTQVDTAGSDTTDGSSTVVFTAPAADGPCNVTITVNDASNPASVLSTVASLTINVNTAAASGNAKVIANLDTYPVISGINATPVPLVKGSASTLTVTASDSDLDTLHYKWVVAPNAIGGGTCVGIFGSDTAASTTFTLDPNSPQTTCTFNVTVDDGNFPDGTPKGGVITNHLSLPVSGPGNTVVGAPICGYDYQTSTTIKAGQVVGFAWACTGGCAGGTISYSTVPVLGAATPASLGLDPAVFTAAGTYTGATGAEDGPTITITATATCSSSGLSTNHVFTLVPLNGVCNGQLDGTNCTSTASAKDKCVLTASCLAGSCHVDTSVTCSQNGVDQCKVNACVSNPSDPMAGQCVVGNKPDNTGCNDGKACTGATGDLCTSGVCGGAAVTCDQTGVAQCQVKSCAEPSGSCVLGNKASTVACDDGNACTGAVVTAPSGSTPGTSADHCDGNGACAALSVSCPSGDVCTPVTGSNTQYTCPLKVCMQAAYAVSEDLPFIGNLAVGPTGEVWTVGSIYQPGWNFGNGTVLNSTGDSDAYLVKLDPATGKASTTTPAVFGFGDGGGNPQSAAAVSVSQSGTVNMIGSFVGEIDFDPTQTNYLIGGTAPTAYYATFGAGSTGTVAPTFVGAHAVDLGDGNLVATASNPFITNSGLDYFAICGNATKVVGLWSAVGSGGKSPAGLLKPSAGTWGGGSDIVVAVIKASDGSVVWGKQFGSDGDETCESVAIDNNGDVIIAGNYGVATSSSTTVNFGGGSLTAKPAVGDAYLYVAKLGGADGHFMAAGGWGSSARSDGTALAIDPSNNIVLAGTIGGSVNFGGGVSIVNAGLTDAYVVKFSSALAPQWAKSFGDNVKDQSANAVACDSSGNIYVGGAYTGSLGSFIGLSVSSSSGPNAWTAEIAPDGSALQCAAQSYGVVAGTDNIITMAVARTATGGEANALFFGGSYASSMTIGSTTLNTGSGGKFESFVARLTP